MQSLLQMYYHCTDSKNDWDVKDTSNLNPWRIFYRPPFLFRCRMKKDLAYGDWQEQEISPPVAHHRLHLQATSIFVRDDFVKTQHTFTSCTHYCHVPSITEITWLTSIKIKVAALLSIIQKDSPRKAFTTILTLFDGKGAWLRTQKLFWPPLTLTLSNRGWTKRVAENAVIYTELFTLGILIKQRSRFHGVRLRVDIFFDIVACLGRLACTQMKLTENAKWIMKYQVLIGTLTKLLKRVGHCNRLPSGAGLLDQSMMQHTVDH